MSWRPIHISNEDAIACATAFPNRTRVFIDESLGTDIALLLRTLGYNVRLCNPGELDSINAGGEELTILFTQDRKLLHDGVAPSEAGAGIVVLLGGKEKRLVTSLLYALAIVGKEGALWRRAKIVVGEDGRLSIADDRDHAGKLQTRRYKLRIDGPPLVWNSKERLSSPRVRIQQEL